MPQDVLAFLKKHKCTFPFYGGVCYNLRVSRVAAAGCGCDGCIDGLRERKFRHSACKELQSNFGYEEIDGTWDKKIKDKRREACIQQNECTGGHPVREKKWLRQ